MSERKKRLNKRQYIYVIITSLVIIGSTITFILVAYYSDKDEGVPLAQNYIHIEKDDDFRLKFNLPGIGSLTNPYIIENYIFENLTDEIAISVKNTTKNFIIRNCFFLNNPVGVILENIAPKTATIMNSTFTNNYRGIKINYCDFVKITQSSFHNNFIGIDLLQTTNTHISEINMDGSHFYPLYSAGCTNGKFFKNVIVNGRASEFWQCSNWSIYKNLDFIFWIQDGNYFQYFNNIVLKNGIITIKCEYAFIANNSFSGEYNSINIGNSYGSQIVNNSFLNGGFSFSSLDDTNIYESYFLANNKVNSKPVTLLVNQLNVLINDSSYGQIFCVNCTNVNINSGNYSKAVYTIKCIECTNVSIINNNISSLLTPFAYFGSGISTVDCVTILISNNLISNCSFGINIYNSTNTVIENNFCSGNGIGIRSYDSGDLKIRENKCIKNNDGISITSGYYKVPIEIIGNNCTSNDNAGISIGDVTGLVSNNTIYYNKIGISMFTGNCTIKENKIISNLECGIYVFFAISNLIHNNTISNSYYGIQLLISSQIEVFYNHIEICASYGVYLESSTDNCVIYSNNFINNTRFHPMFAQACDDGSDNTFYDIDTSIGNYWNDWITGVYSIDGLAGSSDLYPRVVPIIF